jgi:hypothetical protein
MVIAPPSVILASVSAIAYVPCADIVDYVRGLNVGVKISVEVLSLTHCHIEASRGCRPWWM